MLVKIFERTWVIRLFGIALIVAPFVNVASSVWDLPQIEGRYFIYYCWQFFRSAPMPQQVLQVFSVVIGALMLRGSVSAWKYTLGLLGGYIILQFTQLNSGARDNSTWLFLGVNVLSFFFIADQIVLKPRAPQAAKPQPAPPANAEAPPTVEKAPPALEVAPSSVQAVQPQPEAVAVTAEPLPTLQAPVETAPANNVTQLHPPEPQTSAKRVYVNFEGFGNWATISDISEKGIKVRCISEAPPSIESRVIELALQPSLNLRLKFSQRNGSEYCFDFLELSANDRQALNSWLVQVAA